MSSLFDTDGPIELAPPHVVQTLVNDYGYAAEKVKKWTREKADTVLESCRRKTRLDLNHGQASAAAQEPDESRAPNGREIGGRIEAAAFLEQAVATNNEDELVLALTHCVYALIRDEARGFASLILGQLRLNPVTGEPLVRTARVAEVA